MRAKFGNQKQDTMFLFDPRIHMKLKAIERKNLDDLDNYEELAWFVDVAKIVSGDSFGELALMNDMPRAATIKTLTKCSFATLSKEQYNSFLSKIEIK
jgi:hypothetical protein